MSDDEIEALMLDPGIVRNRLKLNATRRNAAAWLALDGPGAGCSGRSSAGCRRSIISRIAAKCRPITPEAVAMSKALKKAGFTFVGPTICYAFMQASWHGHGSHPPIAIATRLWPTTVTMRALRAPKDQE